MSATLRRLDRILAMVPWLLANPGVRIDDVAERFGTTPREVASDLDVLGFCGVPGYGGGDLVEVSVLGDRVEVRMADFFRRPLRLELGEAMTLLLAGRALLGAPDLADPDALRRAVRRLETALGAASVEVDLSAPDRALLARLRDATEHGRVVRLRYRSASSERETSRVVEPWALVAAGGSWYLRGHCRQAQARRDFRVDRIREATVTDERAAPAPEGAVDAPGYAPGEDDLDVLLDVDPSVDWLLDAVPAATAPEPGKVRLQARSLEWAARLVLSLGGAARALEPPELAERVGALASTARALYGEVASTAGGTPRADGR